MLPPGAMMPLRLIESLGATSGSTVLSSLGSVLISEAYVTIQGRVDISDLGCCLREAMWMSEHCAPPLGSIGRAGSEARLQEVWSCRSTAVRQHG